VNDTDQCICDSRPVPPVPRRCHRETAPGKAFCASCTARSCAHHHGIGVEPTPADPDLLDLLESYRAGGRPHEQCDEVLARHGRTVERRRTP